MGGHIDTDGGLDDAVALAVAVRLGVASVSTVGGNVSAHEAYRSAGYVLDRLGAASVSLRVGRDPHGWSPRGGHGVDGLGGMRGRVSLPGSRPFSRSVAESVVGPVVALGPLTNWQGAQREVVALGGVQGCPAGVRDTNVLADVAAAAEVPNCWWVPLRVAAGVTMVHPRPGSWLGRASMEYGRRSSARWEQPSGRFPAYDAAVVCAAFGVGDPVWRRNRIEIGAGGIVSSRFGTSAWILEGFRDEATVRRLVVAASADLG